jgi:hypothetical protein
MQSAKFFFKILTGLLLLTVLSCKKNSGAPAPESQGTNFNTLLKTVSRNFINGGLNITTHYKYNTSGLVIEIKREFSNNSGSADIQTDTYHRKANGQLDSIIYKNISNPQSSPFYNIYKTVFHYNTNGTIAYSLNKTKLTTYPEDSTIYVYQANRIVQRILFRKPSNSNTYILTVTFNYDYDAVGNLTMLDVTWSSPAGSKNCIYTYDNKPNALPVMAYENELYGQWINAFDDILTTPNNILSRRSAQAGDWDWGNKDFEYRYSSNNKPLYQKIRHTGTADFYEVFFYYD